MEKLIKQKRIWFWVALLTCVFAVVSIPVIVLSAINKLFLLMGISIALVVHGFYGSIFYWLAYAKRSTLIRIVKLITNEGLLTAHLISMQTGKREVEVVGIMRECVIKGYVSGYYFDENTLSLCKFVPVTASVECSSCGASVVTTDGIGKCEYCGTNVSK